MGVRIWIYLDFGNNNSSSSPDNFITFSILFNPQNTKNNRIKYIYYY